MADHIWEAESETSLPDDREESEISLPASDRCPDLEENSDDDNDAHESSDESEIDLPDDEKVTQCCAKRCTNNSEIQEYKDFLSRLRGDGKSDYEQRAYNLIVEKAETKSKTWEVLGNKVCKKGFACLCGLNSELSLGCTFMQ